MKFAVTMAGRDPLELQPLLQRFADEQWVPQHLTPEQAAEFVVDQFRRTIAATLAQTVVECVETEPT